MEGSQFHALGSYLLPMEIRKPLRILSLDGDGFRSLSTILILKDIMREVGNKQGRTVQPWEEFDLIAGTSTGGLIAIMLGRLKMSLDECQSAYLEFSRTMLSTRRNTIEIFGRTKDGLQANVRQRTKGLEAAIKQFLISRGLTEDEGLSDRSSQCKVFVCATSVNRTAPVLLRSYDNSQAPDQLYGSCRIWEACRATFASSSSFEPITIGPLRQKFAASGDDCVNPIGVAYDEAISLWPDRIEHAVLVSIGSGGAPSGPFDGKSKKIAEDVTKTVFQKETIADQFFEDHIGMIQQSRLYRYNVQNEISLQEYKETAKITSVTSRYLQSFEIKQKVKQCASSLERTLESDTTTVESTPSRSDVVTKNITEEAVAPPIPAQELLSVPRLTSDIEVPSPALLARLVEIYWNEDNFRRMRDRHLPLLDHQDPTEFEISYGNLDIPWYPLPDANHCRSEILLDTDPGFGFLFMSPETRIKGRCLCFAILLNDYELVRRLLESGANPNFRDQVDASVTKSTFGIYAASKRTFVETPLVLATLMNEKIIMRMLISAGALVNDVHPRTGRTVLHSASYACEESVVELLIAHGADFRVRDDKGRSAIHCATYGKPVTNGKPSNMPSGNIPVMELLLKQGLSIEDADNSGLTPLHTAVYTYQEDATSWLLVKGAYPNAETKEGETPIDFLYTRSHKWIDEDTICLMLIHYGAFMDPKYGRNRLHNAIITWKRPFLVFLLNDDLQINLNLSCLADVNVQDVFGRTPLHYAVLGGQGDSVKDILRAGGDPNVKDKRGYAAIHYAASSSKRVACLHELLRSNRTSIGLVGPGDVTALHLVIQWNQRMVRTWTRRPWEYYGSDPISRDYDVLEILDSLLKIIPPEAKTKAGFTPLSLLFLHAKITHGDDDCSNDDSVSQLLKRSSGVDDDIANTLYRQIINDPDFRLDDEQADLSGVTEAYEFAQAHRFENDARLPFDPDPLVPKIEG